MATKAPSGLSAGARRVWKQITDEFDLNAGEIRILEDACREIDLIDRLEHELDGADLVVAGSMGQSVAHPLAQEIRQHRTVLARLLAALKLPAADDSSGEKSASSSARELAARRWRGA